MTEWIIAGAVVVVALIGGSVLAAVVRRLLGAPSRPEALRGSATAMGSLVASITVVVGLVIALGIVNPDLLSDLPSQLVNYVPKIVAAAVIVIAARAAATAGEIAVNQAMGRAPAGVRARVVGITRLVILGFGVLLAIGQIGVNTTIINLGVAALFFGLAATFTLLAGLGGQKVANEVAAARALRRVLQPGDRLTMDSVHGVVAAVHSTAVEVRTEDGSAVLVPASTLLQSQLTIDRPARP